MFDFITGEKFMGIADFTYCPQVRLREDYCKSVNTMSLERLKNRSIIYTHTFYAKQLMEVVAGATEKLILITHNSDINVDESFILPENILKWYSQNVNVDNKRIESIPIGLENSRWFPKERKKEKMIAKLNQKRKYRNLVYMNHNIKTNPGKREYPFEILKNKKYVTAEIGGNGHNFDHYLDNIYNHKFVVCPEGNGMDTHRFWETLYMGSIPIVVSSINNRFYDDLPVFYVNNWNEISCKLLMDKLGEIESMNWNREKLTFEYWKNKILQ